MGTTGTFGASRWTAGSSEMRNGSGGFARRLCEKSGFRVQGSGFRVQKSGFRVQKSGFRVQKSGFRSLMSNP